MGDSSDEVQHMEGELYEFLPTLGTEELEQFSRNYRRLAQKQLKEIKMFY